MVVAHGADEDLRLVSEPAKRAGVDDTISVPLVGAAIGVGRLGMNAAGRRGAVHGERGQLRVEIGGRINH